MAAFCCWTTHAGEGAATVPGKSALRVAYFGPAQTPREKDFVELLEKHFAKVARGELNSFREADATGQDVVILDYGELKIVNNAIQCPKIPFGERYARPTLTVGATGALVCDMLRLRTGYL
jgi:hypothetical protein